MCTKQTHYTQQSYCKRYIGEERRCRKSDREAERTGKKQLGEERQEKQER